MSNKMLILSVTTCFICLYTLLINNTLASDEESRSREQIRLRRTGSLGDYTSSDRPKKIQQRRSVGSGSRSSCKSKLPENSISLLIPEEKKVHRTSVSRPSFFLQSDVALKKELKFTLVNPQVAQPIVEKFFLILKPGIIKIELPKAINLEPGQVYLWYVAIPCDENDLYPEILSSSVELVPLSNKLQVALKNTTTIKEAVSIYSHNAYWYEALEYSIKENPLLTQDILSKLDLY